MNWRSSDKAIAVVAAVAVVTLAVLLIVLGPDSDSSLAGVTFDAAPVLSAPVARDITDEKAVKVVPELGAGGFAACAGVVDHHAPGTSRRLRL